MPLGFPSLRRRYEPELMDQPGVDPNERADAYGVLRRVNRQFFGGIPVLHRELERWLAQNPEAGKTPLRVLDVAGGSGDLAAEAVAWLAERGVRATPLVVDLDPTAMALASERRIVGIRANALSLPLPDASIDLVIASKFAHHLDDAGVVALLKELGRVCRSAVLVLDLQRHWLAWAGFWLWSRLFTRNRLVRHDGPLSVLRGFLPSELAGHARAIGEPALSWSVRQHPWFQLVLAAHRQGLEREKLSGK